MIHIVSRVKKIVSRCKYLEVILRLPDIYIWSLFCWACSWNVSVLPVVGPLRSETWRSVTMWIKWY